MLPGDRRFTGSETVTLDEAIAYLNGLLAIDAAGVSRVLLARSPVQPALAAHPTVQVAGTPPVTSALGIINGLFGTNAASAGGITARQTPSPANTTPVITQFVRTATPQPESETSDPLAGGERDQAVRIPGPSGVAKRPKASRRN